MQKVLEINVVMDSIQTGRLVQTVYTQIRLLLKEQFDQGLLHCFQCITV